MISWMEEGVCLTRAGCFFIFGIHPFEGPTTPPKKMNFFWDSGTLALPASCKKFGSESSSEVALPVASQNPFIVEYGQLLMSESKSWMCSGKETYLEDHPI